MKKNLLFLLLVNCIATASTLDEIRERGVLKVGVFGNNLPFSIVNEKDAKGMDIEIARALAKAILNDENKVDLVVIEQSDRVASLMSDEVDVVVANFSATKYRSKVVDFGSPYVRSNLVIVAKKSKSISGLTDLSTMRIGAVKNSLGAEFIKKKYPSLTMVEFLTQEEMSDALESNNIDAFIRDSLLTHLLVHENSTLAEKINVGDYEYSAPAVKKGNRELIDLINEEMNKLKADGRLENWYKAYLEPSYGENLDSSEVLVL